MLEITQPYEDRFLRDYPIKNLTQNTAGGETNLTVEEKWALECVEIHGETWVRAHWPDIAEMLDNCLIQGTMTHNEFYEAKGKYIKNEGFASFLEESAKKLLENDLEFPINETFVERYRHKGLKRLFPDWRQVPPNKSLQSAATYLYLGLLKECENLAEAVVIPRKGLKFDQSLYYLGLEPHLLEIHQNDHNRPRSDRSGLEINEIDGLGDISGKVVLIVDNDYATGRTFSDAYELLERYAPKKIILFSEFGRSGFDFFYVGKGSENMHELGIQDYFGAPAVKFPSQVALERRCYGGRNPVREMDYRSIERIIESLVSEVKGV